MRKNSLRWLRWFEPIMRKDNSDTVTIVMEINIDGKMKEEDHRRDGIVNDMKIAYLNVREVEIYGSVPQWWLTPCLHLVGKINRRRKRIIQF